MKKTLELFTTIIGIGSASGLFLRSFLYLISDNSAFYEYNITDTNLNKYLSYKTRVKHSKKRQTRL
jgi:hypothetical protein